MNITCPKCNSAFDVDLPQLDEQGVSLECAQCQHIFQIKKEDIEHSESGSNEMVSPEEIMETESPSEDETENSINPTEDNEVDEEALLKDRGWGAPL